jgi:signal transduction histidine kinase
MQVEQALRALAQLRSAAPPATAERLGEMITLVIQLEAESAGFQQMQKEHAALKAQLKAMAAANLMPQGLAHLKPSLRIVSDHASALAQGKLGSVTTEQIASLRLINEHATSRLGLIDSLETVGRLRQGEIPFEPTVFSGLDLLASVWQRHFAAAEPREHQINIRADNPLPPVKGDFKQIFAVLGDLLDNAIRYTPFGGIIRITAETLGTHVLFTVADNGIGLSEDDTAQIGKPFWRAARQPLVRQHPGSGLRLYLARQLLALHESDLILSGELGVGSTFSFILAKG